MVNVGVALLVYGLDDGVGRKVEDVETQWTGCGPLYMGNKGAVGVRFRVPSDDGGVGEVYTYVLLPHVPYPTFETLIAVVDTNLFFSPFALSFVSSSVYLLLRWRQLCVRAPDCALAQT